MVPKHRDISPFLKVIRDFLLGRKHVTSHRYSDTVSPRTPEAPIPYESPARLFANQYYTRSARSTVSPPIDLVEEQKRKIAAKAAKDAKIAEDAKKAAEAAKTGPKAAVAPVAALKSATPKSDKTKAEKCAKPKRKPKLSTPGKLHMWD